MRTAIAAICLALVATAFPVATFALPVPQPLPQIGSCPFGYGSDSHYCVPSSGARYAILRASGSSCPFGYANEGAYCRADSDRSKTAIPSNGSCPSGYANDGRYCIAPK
jgi:hypothetical protein